MLTRTLASAGPVISYQITNSLPDAQGSPVNLNPTLEKIEGYFTGAVALWLQFWDLNVDPAGGASSAYSEAAGGCRRVLYLGAVQPNGFLWQYMDSSLTFKNLTNGLRACLSTTQATYTAPGASSSTFFVDLEDWELEPQGLIAVGDTVTPVNLLQLWTELNGPNRLVRVEITGLGGVTNVYAQLFTNNNIVANTSVPILQLPGVVIPVNPGFKVFNFGRNGIVPFDKNAGAPVNRGNVRYGCTIALSLTSMLYDGAVSAAIRAYYKAY